MGGFVVVPEEPGPLAAGQVFRAIPASGVLTDGDDTLIGSRVTDFHVSGGQGNDLLVLDYSDQAVRVELDLASGFIGIYDADYGYLASGSAWGFERFRLTGGALDDTLRGGPDGAATLAGEGGDDLIEMRGGNNVMRGGAGNDSIYGASLSDTVSGGAGRDILHVDLSGAGAGVDLGRGFAGADWTGIEHFVGKLTAHDDTLRGGAFVWEADGGDGIDEARLDYRSREAMDPDRGIWFFGNLPFAYVEFLAEDGNPRIAPLWNFERFVVTGTEQGDFMAGGSWDDRLQGVGGNDTLSGGGGRDTLRGGAGDDDLTGNLVAGSLLSGGAGDDTINVWRTDDTVSGGGGFDGLQLVLWDSAAGVQIDLVAGMPDWRGIEAVSGELTRFDDVFRTTALTGPLDGGSGIDLLAFDYSASGADSVDYRFGLLTMTQGGVVTVRTASGFERFDLRGSAGGDALIGEDQDDALQGLAGDDWLGGRGGHDHLQGGAGRDTLFGGAGNDTLDGGSGSDTLEGSAGNDLLTGGLGRDVFWFRGPNLGNDIITDFEAGLDRIVIDPVFEMVPVEQSGADVLIDIMGQTLRVQNASTTDVHAAIVYTDLVLG